MNNEENNSKKTRNRVIRILIIIIIILLLLTSCSLIKFGHIGKLNKEDYIDIKDNVKEIINKNDKLKFDLEDYKKGLIIYLEDGNYKLSYTATSFKSKKYKCTTSDAKIATCIVKDGYVIIKPLKRGKITLTLTTSKNGYKYIAQTTVEIKGGTTKPDHADKQSKKSKHAKQTKKIKSTKAKSTKPKTTNKITKSPGTTKTITKSSDARLASLKVDSSKYKIAPTFNSDVTEYIVVVPKNTNKVNLSGTTSSSKATIISGLGDVELKKDSTIVKIKVKAEDGTTKTYTVKINKKDNINSLSTDATLKSLSLEGYALTPSFNSNTFKYSITVPNSVTSLAIDAIPNYSGSLVTITGNNNFKVGNNTVKIKVNAENGDTNTYTITVNRLAKDKTEDNANLASLEVEGYTLNPSFDKNTYNYTLNGTIPKNINELNVIVNPDDEDSTVTITGNKNLKEGTNTITVTVTSKDGVKKQYTITVNKEISENLNDFYITSPRTYKVGYHDNSNNNYKTIIVNSNILDGNITSNITTAPNGNTKLIISDGDSYLVLEGPFDLEYIEDESNTTSYAIKVSYSQTGTSNIKVSGYRKGNDEAHKVDEYNITFNIEDIYYVTLNANDGFFTSLSDKYELSFFYNEELDLSPYNEAYKYSDKENCKSYKFIGFDEDKTNTNSTFKLDTNGNFNTSKITITSDLDLYAIYDTNDDSVTYTSSNRLYLTDVDIFVLPDGTKNFIYPGTEGSYIMHIKNTTGSTITLNKLNIEEDTICTSNSNCLNMGYIIKRYNNNNYTYYNPTNIQTNEYWILNKESNATMTANIDGSYHFNNSLDLNQIKLENGEETEISLLWKWVDSDGDTEIGNYVIDNNDIYKLTISYDFDKEETTCDN